MRAMTDDALALTEGGIVRRRRSTQRSTVVGHQLSDEGQHMVLTSCPSICKDAIKLRTPRDVLADVALIRQVSPIATITMDICPTCILPVKAVRTRPTDITAVAGLSLRYMTTQEMECEAKTVFRLPFQSTPEHHVTASWPSWHPTSGTPRF